MADIVATHIDDDGIADVVRCDGEYYAVELNGISQWCIRCYSPVVPDDVLCIDVRTGSRFGDVATCGYDDKRMCSENLLRYLEDIR